MSDWFLEDKLTVCETAFGDGIISLIDYHVEPGQQIIIAPFYGLAIFESTIKKLSAEQASYIFGFKDSNNNDMTASIDLRNNWLGRINHACQASGMVNVLMERGFVFLIKSVSPGTELFIDYGIEYWTFQVTHIDLEDWEKEKKEDIRRDASWLEWMHHKVNDYRELLGMKLYTLKDDKRQLLDKLNEYLLRVVPPENYI